MIGHLDKVLYIVVRSLALSGGLPPAVVRVGHQALELLVLLLQVLYLLVEMEKA